MLKSLDLDFIKNAKNAKYENVSVIYKIASNAKIWLRYGSL